MKGMDFERMEYTQFVCSSDDENKSYVTVSEVKKSMQTLCLARHDPEDEGTTVLRNVCKLFTSRHGVIFRKAELCSSIRVRTYSFVFHEILLCSLFITSFGNVEFVFMSDENMRYCILIYLSQQCFALLYPYIYIVYIYIHTYTHTPVSNTLHYHTLCVCVHTHTHTYIYIYIHIYTYTNTSQQYFAFLYIYIYIYIYIYLCVCIHTHTHISQQYFALLYPYMYTSVSNTLHCYILYIPETAILCIVVPYVPQQCLPPSPSKHFLATPSRWLWWEQRYVIGL